MEGISVEQATEMILQYTPVINETEEIELDKTGGRILAQDMVAEFDNPPFDKSPVDMRVKRKILQVHHRILR